MLQFYCTLLRNQNLIAGYKNINFSVVHRGFKIGLLAKGKENRIRDFLKKDSEKNVHTHETGVS
jgi:hypothetical protein